MNIIVRGKQFKVTDALREYAQKRVGKLEKFTDDLADVHVVLSVERERQKVEVTAPLNGLILRGEEATADMYTSIDLVVEKLERQISKYRKRIDKKRGKSLKEEAILAEQMLDEAERDQLVRTKKFQIKPMSVDEALMQMNLLGHNFYVFMDVDTEKFSVVYRREDGDYGLLEPEY